MKPLVHHNPVHFAALAFALFWAVNAFAVLDPDMEKRCRDIDAMGGANSCVCSEPLITSGSINSGSYNPPGSTSKQCGDSSGNAFYFGGTPMGFKTPASWYSVPLSSGISKVFVYDLASGELTGRYANEALVVPSNVKRICHRAMFRFDPTTVGRNLYDTPPGMCGGLKSIEFNPSPYEFGNQFQGGFDSTMSLYFTGTAKTADAGFSNLNMSLQDCKNNWCSTEQCWYGDFSTGAIRPIGRSYVVSASSGTIVPGKDFVHNWSGTMSKSFGAPVKIHTDRILNLYKELSFGPCPGMRAIVYAMEANFGVADDGPSILNGKIANGPWIGPPLEFAGGGAGPTRYSPPAVPSLIR